VIGVLLICRSPVWWDRRWTSDVKAVSLKSDGGCCQGFSVHRFEPGGGGYIWLSPVRRRSQRQLSLGGGNDDLGGEAELGLESFQRG
jgi:hypothetical protein